MRSYISAVAEQGPALGGLGERRLAADGLLAPATVDANSRPRSPSTADSRRADRRQLEVPYLVRIDLAQAKPRTIGINQLSASAGPTSTACPNTCLDASGDATNCWAVSTFPYVRTASSNSRCWKPLVRQPDMISRSTPSDAALRAAFWTAASSRIQPPDHRVRDIEGRDGLIVGNIAADCVATVGRSRKSRRPGKAHWRFVRRGRPGPHSPRHVSATPQVPMSARTEQEGRARRRRLSFSAAA